MEEVETLELDEKPKKKKLKKWVKVLLTLFIIIILIVVSILILFSYLMSPISSRSEVIEFTVENGSSAYMVGKKLEKEKIIRNYYAYKIYIKLKKIDGYKAGVYKLDKSYSTKEIVDLLSGDYYKKDGITITFKEGKTIRGVAKEIAKKTNISESEVYSVIDDDTYIDSLISKYWFLSDDIKNAKIYYSLEGYLFPDTYAFKNKDVSVKDIFDKMLLNMDSKLTPYKEEITKSKYSVHELITLASIVELEGASSDDRNGVAGVFYNRLNAGWTLGSDVTSYYGAKVDMNERELYRSELNDCNAYNTRCKTFKGLPVGPIANPGIESIEAVLNPSKHSYYYFVADKNKKTYFTKTEKEHNQIIAKLKKENLWYEYDD